MPKKIEVIPERVTDSVFRQLDYRGNWYEVSFPENIWEISNYYTNEHNQTTVLWYSRRIEPRDVKARVRVFRRMFKQHEIMLRRKEDASRKRKDERRRSIKSTGDHGRSAKEVRRQQNW